MFTFLFKNSSFPFFPGGPVVRLCTFPTEFTGFNLGRGTKILTSQVAQPKISSPFPKHEPYIEFSAYFCVCPTSPNTYTYQIHTYICI